MVMNGATETKRGVELLHDPVLNKSSASPRPRNRRWVGIVRSTNSEWARVEEAAMPTAGDPLYRRHRFPPELISYAVWLYFRFPLSLRMVEEMLAARGICVTYETVRQWGKKFGKAFAGQCQTKCARMPAVVVA